MMRRGFALTLSIIILIFFLVLILSVESQRIMIEEQARSSHARMRAVTTLLSDMDSPALDYAVSKMAKRALYDADMEVIKSNKGMKNAKQEVCNKFTEMYKKYLNSLKLRAMDSGLTLMYDDKPPALMCSLELVDGFTVQVSIGTRVTISGEGIHVTKALSHTENFTISGIYDPYIALNSYDPNMGTKYNTVLIPIIKSKVGTGELSKGPGQISTSGYGKGWGYGTIISSDDALLMPDSALGTKILLITSDSEFSRWKDPRNLSKFAGVILVKSSLMALPTIYERVPMMGIDDKKQPCSLNVTKYVWNENTAPCISCGEYSKIVVLERSVSTCEPQIAGVHYNEGNNYYTYVQSSTVSDPQNIQGKKNIVLNDVPFIVVSGVSVTPGQKVLISSTIERDLDDTVMGRYPPVHDDIHVYDIEKQRAAVLCANYFFWKDANQGKSWGPDIFSRLEGKSSSDKYGIESFVIGPWASAEYSKIDHEYYSRSAGHLAKGMPGCISPNMCNRPAKELQIGHFLISAARDSSYGLDGEGVYLTR
ncbi:MAG: hypothetical protein N3G76_02715 [Candidatus Micrarchaeota archaeon]|nr:hypothetical protein [Candidatus Micrarchaeota archaeon]